MRHAASVDHKDAISIVQLQIERVAIEEKSQSSRNDGLTGKLRMAYCLAKEEVALLKFGAFIEL